MVYCDSDSPIKIQYVLILKVLFYFHFDFVLFLLFNLCLEISHTAAIDCEIYCNYSIIPVGFQIM